MKISLIFFILGVIVLLVVVPLFLLFSFIEKMRSRKILSKEDELVLANLWKEAKKLEERVRTLETIMGETNQRNYNYE